MTAYPINLKHFYPKIAATQLLILGFMWVTAHLNNFRSAILGTPGGIRISPNGGGTSRCSSLRVLFRILGDSCYFPLQKKAGDGSVTITCIFSWYARQDSNTAYGGTSLRSACSLGPNPWAAQKKTGDSFETVTCVLSGTPGRIRIPPAAALRYAQPAFLARILGRSIKKTGDSSIEPSPVFFLVRPAGFEPAIFSSGG